MNKLRIWQERFARFIRKNNATIGLTIVALAAGSILFFQTLALSKLEADLENQKQLITATKNLATSLDSHAAERTKQIDQLNKHLDCIVIFFTNPDRANKTIEDIDDCTLKTTSTGDTSSPTGSSSPTSKPATSTQTAPSAAPKASTTPTPSPTPSPTPGFVNQLTTPVKNLFDFLF